MNRIASIIAGLAALPIIVAGGTHAEPESRSASAIANPDPLCTKSHPSRRRPDVTYGGLLPEHGYQRDHLCPLGLGCPDAIDNVRYQRCDKTGQFGRCESGPAAVKDTDEHFAEEEYCSGKWPLDYARSWLAARWPVDAAHGYDKP